MSGHDEDIICLDSFRNALCILFVASARIVGERWCRGPLS